MIQINNLTKSFKNPETGQDQIILKISDLSFEKGKSYALFGPSGIGKTTLLHIISGLLVPDSGTVTINGSDITKKSESARDRFRADNVGYIFQTFNLLDGFTALENVTLGMLFSGKGSDKNRAENVLTSVGLGSRLNYKPGQLSVGQQQRVAVARAIVNDPDILLADEPTGNLDPANTNEILDLLFEKAKGKTLIVVTHEENILSRFDVHIDMLNLIPSLTH